MRTVPVAAALVAAVMGTAALHAEFQERGAAAPAPPRLFAPSNFNELTMGAMPGSVRFELTTLSTVDYRRPRTAADPLIVSGDSWRQMSQPERSLSAYREAVSSKSEAPALGRAYLGLALTQAISNSWDDAFASLQQALKLNPEFASTRTGGGLMYMLRTDFKTAATWFREALKLDPASFEAHYYLGWTLLHGLGTDEATAAASFRSALKLQPGRLEAATGLGMVSIKAGRLDDAIAAFLQPIKAGRTDSLAYWFLGLAYLNANRRADAQALIQKFQSVDKKLAAELATIATEWK